MTVQVDAARRTPAQREKARRERILRIDEACKQAGIPERYRDLTPEQRDRAEHPVPALSDPVAWILDGIAETRSQTDQERYDELMARGVLRGWSAREVKEIETLRARLAPKPAKRTRPDVSPIIRIAETILKEHGRPMHQKALAPLIIERNAQLPKDQQQLKGDDPTGTVHVQLAKHARAGKVVLRVAPGVFGLTCWTSENSLDPVVPDGVKIRNSRERTA